MTSPGSSGLAQSVQARLKNEATPAGRPFAELLELYAVERFLHRLGRSRHCDRFLLKGALRLRRSSAAPFALIWTWKTRR